MWRDQVTALDGWRRIAPDLRGMGLSEAPERGYGMGGYVAFEVLRRHRERVAALVVLDARAEADTAERKAGRDDLIARVRNGGAGAPAEELAPTLLAENAPAGAGTRLREMTARAAAAGVVGALEAMRDRPDSGPVLRSNANLPALLLIGEHDTRTQVTDKLRHFLRGLET